MDQHIVANGIRLHYLEHGTGVPLVLMPGLTGNAHTFDGLMGAGLSEHRRVLALDLRGRGGSDKPPTGYRMADHAADVLSLLDGLGLARVILGGHSFGGLLSFYIAAHHPERVSKLIIIDAAATLHPRARELLEPALARLGKVYDSWETYLDNMKRMPYFHAGWEPALESSYRAELEFNADGTVQACSPPGVIREALEGLLTEPWEEHVARIAQPTLLINALGAYGPPGSPPLLPQAQAQATVARLAHGHYVEVSGNHLTMLYGSGARQTVAAIDDFLADG